MNSQNENSILSAVNIRKEFIVKKHFITGKTLDKVVAVKNSSFNVIQGKTIGIVGESGSGKSTTGEIVGGLLKPTFGKVCYRGRNIEELSYAEYKKYRKNVQFIFQDPKGSMDPNYKIGHIISEPLFILNYAKNSRDAEKMVDDILEKVGLDSAFKNKYPLEMSGGQCQRAAIARALVVKPHVIICDEPVSALDVSIQAQILNLLKDLQKEYNIAYIFISHDIGVVNYMADEIMVMNMGNVVEMGEAKQILTNSKEKYTKKLIESSFI
ncbi:ABC-type microcin C transport system duplicated ATPase subunit YejF [Sedimentibacter acidaminivorans]|uniref:ABC-type microcin C transport system duplicated ATPase subunit YejF n=1 Tax=Sedimentibacter acidaminivorans TaxID=913099 RepID=A0ABS4GGX6_9FIRM|nr:ATP-binding cassette domain-containing protein [Sedimentibacter acidaminivorans]MBP1926943.1 ABC-type microcin C transport system duplicated ATPase subunit YejF [Sedimentibacter acidaminivorans]